MRAGMASCHPSMLSTTTGTGLLTSDREPFQQDLTVWATAEVGLGRAASWLSRAAGRGDGAIIGGRVALVTGTNGKSTTTHMITAALRAHYGRVASNHTGANMPDGHTAALAGDRTAQHAVLEVDELHLHHVANQTHPEVFVLLNLSR